MDIDGYELGAIAYMTSSGPLWTTRGRGGEEALVSVHSGATGRDFEGRWRRWAGVIDRRVARLLDVVRNDDGRWALVQERAPGRPLDILLGGSALRARVVRESILDDVAGGLAALHAAGIVHGDLAPANVVVDGGRAVLVDLAVPSAPGEGTVGYSLSPVKDEAADLEALGRLAEELGLPLREDEEASATTALDRSPKPEEEGTPSIGAESAACETDPSEALRRAARREATIRTAGRREPVRLLVPIAAGALIVGGAIALVLADSSIARGGASAESSVPASAAVAGSGSASCPGAEEAGERLRALVAARDAALESRDPRALEGRVGGALARQDGERIEALLAAGETLEDLRTGVEVIGEPECADSRVRVRARLVEESGRLCSQGTCRELVAGRGVVLDLAFPEGAWIALEAAAAPL